MPVLPDVPSIIVPPGLSAPARSASSIILSAMRSLIELPGLNVSIFASTVPLTMPLVILLIRTIGVSPIASRMVSPIFFTIQVYTDAPSTPRPPTQQRPYAAPHRRSRRRRRRGHQAEEDR